MKTLDKIKASLSPKDPAFQQAIKQELEKTMNDLHQQMNSDFLGSNGNINSFPLPPGFSIGQQQGVGTLGIPQVMSAPWTHQSDLTDAEKAELDNLTKDRQQKEKLAKLAIFKTLPREFRQNIINILLWEDAIDEMNAVISPMDNREAELSTKRSHASIYPFAPTPGHSSGFGGLGSLPSYGSQAKFRAGLSLPNGISREELLQAHLDASMEEELIGD